MRRGILCVLLLFLPGCVDYCGGPGEGTDYGPAISLQPDLIAFPETPVGSYADLNLSIGNDGDQDLEVYEFAFDAPDDFCMVLNAEVEVIQPGRNLSVYFCFEPTTTGEQTGQLTIRSNDEASPTRVVEVSGSGV